MGMMSKADMLEEERKRKARERKARWRRQVEEQQASGHFNSDSLDLDLDDSLDLDGDIEAGGDFGDAAELDRESGMPPGRESLIMSRVIQPVVIEAESQIEIEVDSQEIETPESLVESPEPIKKAKRVKVEAPEVESRVEIPWGQLQDEILAAHLEDEEVWDLADGAIQSLAKRLRSSVEELQAIYEATNLQDWAQKRMTRLLELERLRRRGFNWDKLEDAALQKMSQLVEKGKVKALPELLAIARVANQATRRGVTAGGGNEMADNPKGVYIQNNIYPAGDPRNAGSLPGPGSIGTVSLSLSQRTMKQLSQGKTIDGESQKFSESIDMITPKGIPELSKMADDTK